MSTSITEIYGRVILAVAVVAMLLSAARAFAAPVVVTPQGAIEQAVARRTGGALAVTVTALQTSVAPEAWLEAVPEPGGRTGQPMRFVMMAGTARRGIAVATVTLAGRHARAARVIARDQAIAAGDVGVVDGPLPAIAIGRVPAEDEVIGLRAKRNIAAGEVLTPAVLVTQPLVRAGDLVTVTAVVGAVRVSGEAVASSSGHGGDVIRVVPKPNGRPVKGRITGQGLVEVVQ